MRELELLERLSYIVEAIAEEASGEAKRELDRLCESVETALDVDPEVRHISLGWLRAAQGEIREHPYSLREAAAPLCGLSRILWKRILSSEAKAPQQ